MKTLESAEEYKESIFNAIEVAKNRIKKTKSKQIIEICKNRIKILSPKLKEVQLDIKKLKATS